MEIHDAKNTALGFYYQTFFALLTLIRQDTDNATVGIEQLDDIEINADGQTSLNQLKHSITKNSAKLSISSRALWRTLNIWCKLLPQISLSETTFHLITVGAIKDGCELNALTKPEEDRSQLVKALKKEAQRIIQARDDARKKNKTLPYKDRSDGCSAFLSLSDTDQKNLVNRITINPNSLDITQIEEQIAAQLLILPIAQRSIVARKLIQWWDREVVYSLCGKRQNIISRTELQAQISSIISDIEREKLLPDFETIDPPEHYQPEGMLTLQIQLVKGKNSDLSNAIREEWRAREQRSKWLHDNPGMATTINEYDKILKENWSDKHQRIVEDCLELCEEEKCTSGLGLLRWTHDMAPQAIHPIHPDWNAPYYVRGSYQVLATNLIVGWHPEYKKLLEKTEQ